MKRHAPATARNSQPLAEVLARELPASGTVLEIASGSGEHAVFMARRFPALDWQPSDRDAEALASDPDDFSAASDELSHLQWIRLDALRSIDMPFITEVVLAEVAARAHDERPPASVPFFRNDDEESLFLRLYGRPMQD